jgi:hypothetical protein
MGYKNIMNLPDFQKNGYRTIKQETQADPQGNSCLLQVFFIPAYPPVISGSIAMDPIHPLIRGIAIQRINKPAEQAEGNCMGIKEKAGRIPLNLQI